jgi:elongation factor 1 alpha-like protein
MPIKEKAIVKKIFRNKESIKTAYAGDNVEVSLKDIQMNQLTFGQIISPTYDVVKVTNKFSGRIEIFDLDRPIIRGSKVMLHIQNISINIVISKIYAILDENQEVIYKRPRCLLSNCFAQIQITTEIPICVEKFSDYNSLGRFLLRNNGKTIAAGLITRVKKIKNHVLAEYSNNF